MPGAAEVNLVPNDNFAGCPELSGASASRRGGVKADTDVRLQP
jgi:hypothetical protein